MTDYKQLCAKVLAYYEGQDEYDFSHLGAIARDNAAFDAWQELRAELKTALAKPEESPQPVPVSERLPGPEDCDAGGRCWLLTMDDFYPQWCLYSIQSAQPGGKMIWVPVDSESGDMLDCFYASHWLPFQSLPIPNEVDE